MNKVAVIFGSRSAEHDVSVVTAINAVISPMKLASGYQPIPVYIDKQGHWYSDKSLGNIEYFTTGDVKQKLSKMKRINISLNDGLKLIKPAMARDQAIDMVFPATHGTFGEDGSLMGLLRMADVPFVGCDMQAAAVAMDKGLTKIVTEAYGLQGPEYVLFSDRDYGEDPKAVHERLAKLKFPLFVKPTHLGSSIAITRVENIKQLENAIELALHYDNGLIVEEAVPNLIEVTVPVMGNDEPVAALVEEALKKDADFFDFQTKYMQGGKKGKGKSGGKNTYSRLPADISKDLYKKSEEMALAAYKAIGASGIARVDLLIDSKKNTVYLNEINPLPGSLYAHNWKKAGVSGVDLVTKLLEYAQDYYNKQKKLETVFDTNYLAQF